MIQRKQSTCQYLECQGLHFFNIGGLAAVIYTDTFQTAVMTIGAIVLTIMGKGELKQECLHFNKMFIKCPWIHRKLLLQQLKMKPLM